MLELCVKDQSHYSVDTLTQTWYDLPGSFNPIFYFMLVLLQPSDLFVIKLVANDRVSSHFSDQEHCLLYLRVQLLLRN